MDYAIPYDTTLFVRESHHGRGARRCSRRSALVVLVVLVFLQSWRATLIPLLAMPVSLIGTFAVM